MNATYGTSERYINWTIYIYIYRFVDVKNEEMKIIIYCLISHGIVGV